MEYLFEILSISADPSITDVRSWSLMMGIDLNPWESLSIMKMISAFRGMRITGEKSYDPMLDENELSKLEMKRIDNFFGDLDGVGTRSASGKGRSNRVSRVNKKAR